MRETRRYTVALTREEVLVALKRTYPESLVIRSIPTGPSSGATMAADNAHLTFVWSRDCVGDGAE